MTFKIRLFSIILKFYPLLISYEGICFFLTILYIDIDIRKENFSKSTNALQTEIHSFTQAQNKRIFTWDFQEKTNKRTSTDVNRPEIVQTSPLKAHFDNALQEGENVNFFTLSRPRQNYSAKCLASFRLGLGLQTFFNFMFIKTSPSLFILWSLGRPPNCIWPWDW